MRKTIQQRQLHFLHLPGRVRELLPFVDSACSVSELWVLEPLICQPFSLCLSHQTSTHKLTLTSSQIHWLAPKRLMPIQILRYPAGSISHWISWKQLARTSRRPESPTTVSSRRRWLRLAVPAGPVGLARAPTPAPAYLGAEHEEPLRASGAELRVGGSFAPLCNLQHGTIVRHGAGLWLAVRVSGDTRVASQHKAPPIGDAP